jgi:chromosome segregation ATPase
MLTLEERERIAYITNSPDHPLIVRAIEGDEEVQADLNRAEDELKQTEADNDRLVGEKEKLEEEIGEAETRIHTLSGQVEDLEIQVGDLKEKIHEAGVDLVA